MNPSELRKYRRQLRNKTPLLGGWLQGHALRSLAEDNSAEAARLLADEVIQGDDPGQRAAAFEALEQSARQGSIAAREALCRLVLRHNHRQAREVVFEAGYLPHDEVRRALFFFLTEKWKAYEKLDFDHHLLREAYDAADGQMRARIATTARRSGRLDWVDIVAGGRKGRRLGTMTQREWQAALAVLEEGERWADLWQLAQDAPPRWSAAILRGFKRIKTLVRKEDQPLINELIRLAKRWKDDDLRPLIYHRTTLEGHSHEVRCLGMTPAVDLLASGSADHTIRLWSLPDGQPLKTLEGHAGWINCLAITPNGKLLASAGRDGLIGLWRLPTGRRLEGLKGHDEAILCLAMDPAGRILASGSADQTIQLWKLPSGDPIKHLKGHAGSISCLTVTPDGELLASGSADGTVRLWSLPDGRARGTLTGHRDEAGDGILGLAISPDGRLLASTGTDATIRLWSLPDGRELKRLRINSGNASALAVTPDSRTLISVGGNHAVQLWRLPNGRNLKALDGLVNDNPCLALNADGKVLASASSGGWGIDHTVRVWNLPGSRVMRMLPGHSGYVTCLALSPDGLLLASGSGDSTIRLWSAELARLSDLPVCQATLQDLEWVQTTLTRDGLNDTERACLEFLAALMRWRRRSDIVVETAAPRVLEVGAFDIEIEG
jgi:WD40 repeat protein